MFSNEDASVVIRRATVAERPAALELVLSAQPADHRQEQIAEWLAEAENAKSLAGLWVADRGGQLLGASLARCQPGKSATVWPAQVIDVSLATTLAPKLLVAVMASLAAEDVRSVQALLPAGIGSEHDQLSAAGFDCVAELLLQVCFLDKRSAVDNVPPGAGSGLTFVPYGSQFRSRLCGIVQATYQGSLDCPTLDRARDVHDVLEGYAAHGDGGTSGWFLVERSGVDAGCLLLAHDRRLGYTELVYMGLVPEARGHGLSRELVRYAQELARNEGLLRMSLAVDAANSPAIAAYQRGGFITWEKKGAYFRRIEPVAPSRK